MLRVPLPWVLLTVLSCTGAAHDTKPVDFPIRGAWLHGREHFGLDSAHGDAALARMRALGVTHVAIGQEVLMPVLAEPKLVFGHDDAELRSVLRRVRAAGLQAFLLPRIESPDFFKPPYPFRADIRFETAEAWEQFHAEIERMGLHYGSLAQSEGVAIFGLSLELKQSAKGFPERWRAIARKVRTVFHGQIAYSANWYDEWEQITFWDALDFVAVGAYFEIPEKDRMTDRAPPPCRDRAGLVRAWQPIVARLAAAAAAANKPILFTEIGYTGYADCAERPWEWAGKQAKGTAIDHARQADALAAALQAFGNRRDFAGMFVWSFFTDTQYVKDWEYALEGRPAQAVLRQAYSRRP